MEMCQLMKPLMGDVPWPRRRELLLRVKADHYLMSAPEQGWGWSHYVISFWVLVSRSQQGILVWANSWLPVAGLGGWLRSCCSDPVLLQVEISTKSSFSPVNTSGFGDYRAGKWMWRSVRSSSALCPKSTQVALLPSTFLPPNIGLLQGLCCKETADSCSACTNSYASSHFHVFCNNVLSWEERVPCKCHMPRVVPLEFPRSTKNLVSNLVLHDYPPSFIHQRGMDSFHLFQRSSCDFDTFFVRLIEPWQVFWFTSSRGLAIEIPPLLLLKSRWQFIL